MDKRLNLPSPILRVGRIDLLPKVCLHLIQRVGRAVDIGHRSGVRVREPLEAVIVARVARRRSGELIGWRARIRHIKSVPGHRNAGIRPKPQQGNRRIRDGRVCKGVVGQVERLSRSGAVIADDPQIIP